MLSPKPIIPYYRIEANSVSDTNESESQGFCFKPEKKYYNRSKKTHLRSPSVFSYKLSDCRNEQPIEYADISDNSQVFCKLPIIPYIKVSSQPKYKQVPQYSDSFGNESAFKKLNHKIKQEKKRVIRSYACGTKPGQAVVGKEKQNQDSIIAEGNFGSDGTSQFFGIADGHGKFGEKVSFFIKSNLSRMFLF